MKTLMVILIILGVILLLGTFNYLFVLKRPGVYPPKQIIKKRVTAMASGGVLFLLFALILSFFS